MKRLWLIVFLSGLLFGCLDRAIDKRDLKIYNKSNNTIYFFISENDVFINPYQDYSNEVIDVNYSVKQDTFAYFIDNPINWDEFIKDCEGGKMRLYIVAKDSVDKYGLTKVIFKNIYTRKYFLDIDYLNKTNWVIQYKDK